MSETCNLLKEINDEFIAIQNSLRNYVLRIIERENLLQIEFDHPVALSDLRGISDLKYFSSFVVNESRDVKYFINAIEDSKRDMSIEYLRDKQIRIKLDKQEKIGEICGIDYFFFTNENIAEFLDTIEDSLSKDKLNFAYFGSENFSTPLINFIGVNMIPETTVKKIPIAESIFLQVNRLLQNTEGKFTPYNNAYSLFPESNNYNSFTELKLSLIKKFYHSFFKLVSYKFEDQKYDIRGKKKIFISEDKGFSVNNYKIFFEIIKFLFEDEKFLEKYIIIKNVLTRYVNDKETFSNLDTKIIEINKTINYYFEKYVQDDLEIFFQNRDVVFKEAINMSKSINEQNDKVNSYINTSLISLLILAISFIFKNFISLNNLSLLFANIFLITFSIIFYNFIFKTSTERFRTIQDQFNLFLDKMGIILLDEKEEINYNFIIKPKQDLFMNIKRIRSIMIYSNSLLLGITIILFSYSYYLFIFRSFLKFIFFLLK